MKIPRVASRYAKALVGLAAERKELDAVKQDAELLLSALKESRELRVLFASPVVKADIKENVVKEAFGSSVQEITLKFISLVIQHRREHSIKEILERYIALYLVEKDVITASITTPIAMDDSLRTEFKNMIQGISKKEVEVEENVNPDIIGGYVLRVGDHELDASLAGKLKRLQTEFKDNPYVAEI
jgi:F-type H+-transporting ATPase subunit delta